MSNGKAMIILLTVGLIRNISLYQISYFPERNTRSQNKIKVQLGLLNYEKKKSDLKKRNRCLYIKIC